MVQDNMKHSSLASSRKRRLTAAAARYIRTHRQCPESIAFEGSDEALIAETWDALGVLGHDPTIMAELRKPYRAAFWHRLGGTPAFVASIAVVLVMAGFWLFSALSVQTYQTRLGEQRLVQLDEGSQVTLNTDSRIEVRLNNKGRYVKLVRGEAYFDVAKLGGTPFIVTSGLSEVRVTGTRFNVRKNDVGVRVDVLEGRVLAGAGAGRVSSGAAALTAFQAVGLDNYGLVRWRGAAEDQRIDNWRRGRVYFDETPLREAVTEMNRYGRVKLKVTTAAIGDMPVSGVFRAGASESFATALSVTYPVKAELRGDIMEISQDRHLSRKLE